MFNRDKVLNVRDHVAFHMDKIIEQFLKGAKITVIIRGPRNVDGSQDFIMTDDDFDEVIKVLKRRKTRGNEYQAKGSEKL